MSLFLTILMWTGIVVGGLVALAVIAFVALLVWSLFTDLSTKGVEFDIASPALVGDGEPFTMTVSVRNLLDQPRKFRSLDFEDSLLKGFVIERLEPIARESTSSWGSTAHHYELDLPPKGSVLFTLSCRALKPGDYTGDVMVYVDHKTLKNVTKVWRLVVR